MRAPHPLSRKFCVEVLVGVWLAALMAAVPGDASGQSREKRYLNSYAEVLKQQADRQHRDRSTGEAILNRAIKDFESGHPEQIEQLLGVSFETGDVESTMSNRVMPQVRELARGMRLSSKDFFPPWEGLRKIGKLRDCFVKFSKETSEVLRDAARAVLIETSILTVESTLQDRPDPFAFAEANCPKGGGDFWSVDQELPNFQWSAACTKSNKINKDKTAEPHFPTTAALIYDDGGGESTFCTGALIAPNAVLTSAHCFCEARARDPQGTFYRSYYSCMNGYFYRRANPRLTTDPRNVHVYLQHAGRSEVERVVLHRSFNWNGRLPRADLALVFLKSSVAGVEPADWKRAKPASHGETGTSVGFGAHTPMKSATGLGSLAVVDAHTGLKLNTSIRLSPCSTLERWRGFVCSIYDPGGGFGSTCHGDSGGPLLLTRGDKIQLAGITTAGDSCYPGARAYYSGVEPFERWISETLKANPAPAVAEASRKNVRQIRCTVCESCGDRTDQTLPNKTKPLEYAIPTPPAKAKFLRVSVNCTANRRPLKLQIPETDCIDGDKGNKAAVTCEVPVAKLPKDRPRILISGPPTRDCQVVASTYD